MLTAMKLSHQHAVTRRCGSGQAEHVQTPELDRQLQPPVLVLLIRLLHERHLLVKQSLHECVVDGVAPQATA